MEFSANSVQPKEKLTLHSGCSLCQAIHMHPTVSGARKKLIWAVWDSRLMLVTWVVVDVERPLIYEGHIAYTFCCDNLWKSIIMALESLEIWGNFFLLLCGHPAIHIYLVFGLSGFLSAVTLGWARSPKREPWNNWGGFLQARWDLVTQPAASERWRELMVMF